jgi:hypothetical protein
MRPRQPHPKMNKDEHEEEERNSHTDCHDCRENDHQEHNLWEVYPQELRNKGPYGRGDRKEDAGDLRRVIVDLERICTYMENAKTLGPVLAESKSVAVDKLLMGIDSPFTRRLASSRLL